MNKDDNRTSGRASWTWLAELLNESSTPSTDMLQARLRRGGALQKESKGRSNREGAGRIQISCRAGPTGGPVVSRMLGGGLTAGCPRLAAATRPARFNTGHMASHTANPDNGWSAAYASRHPSARGWSLSHQRTIG